MADARRTILAGEDFDGATFSDGDLAEVVVTDKRFHDCRFVRTRFVEARLGGCTFDECVFEDCDLTMADVATAAFRDVTFRRSKLMGIDWTDVREFLFAVSFDACNLSHGTFADRKMPGTEFRDCRAHETSFVGVDLSGAVFGGTDLRGARFIDTILADADFSHAVHYDISPRQNRLENTKFSLEAALALVEDLGIVVP